MKQIVVLLFASFTLNGHAFVVDWGKAADLNRSPKQMVYKSAIRTEEGQQTLLVSSVPVRRISSLSVACRA